MMSGSLLARCASALVGLLLALGHAEHLEVINEWRTLTFDFPPGFPMHSFIPENNIFTGVTVSEDRIFFGIPRFREGVPATVGWVPRNTPHDSTLSTPIRAYPDWSWHSRTADCSGLISVFRTRLDHCNRLWVLDSGVTTSFDDFTVVCPPKLLVFDIKNDRLLRAITLPPEVLKPRSLMTNLVLDEANEFGHACPCDDLFVYMADSVEPGLVVYNSAKNTMWRINHPTMQPDPYRTTIKIAGDSFVLADGINGMALSPPSHNRQLYFQPLASNRMYTVATAALRIGPPPAGQLVSVHLVSYKSSQAVGLAINSKGHVYFCPVTETALLLWDPLSEDSGTEVVAYSSEWLQFLSDITIPNDGSEDVYMISNRFQKFFNRIWDPREINLRVLRIHP